ncbi:hypothetical protein EBI_24338 [Enterocytozoon bieneusi H348]|nr:hypothetical protein EBI_24338 [Enterocytozoon bieneusi H348]|eukprot:XP_002649843.1 hypothetical protein EBI_24338 [Enterocytozoon bieneusi H348]
MNKIITTHEMTNDVVYNIIKCIEVEDDVICSQLSKKINLIDFVRSYAHILFFNNYVIDIRKFCKNIFSITTKIPLDDLIYKFLKNPIIDCEWFYYIVQKLILNRNMLKVIFEGVLYKDAVCDKYKFKVLEIILRKYAFLDNIIDTKYNLENTQYQNDAKVADLIDIYCTSLFNEHETTNNDNAYVLVNLLWEEINIYTNYTNDYKELGSLFITAMQCTNKFLIRRLSQKNNILPLLKKDKSFIQFYTQFLT